MHMTAPMCRVLKTNKEDIKAIFIAFFFYILCDSAFPSMYLNFSSSECHMYVCAYWFGHLHIISLNPFIKPCPLSVVMIYHGQCNIFHWMVIIVTFDI